MGLKDQRKEKSRWCILYILEVKVYVKSNSWLSQFGTIKFLMQAALFFSPYVYVDIHSIINQSLQNNRWVLGWLRFNNYQERKMEIEKHLQWKIVLPTKEAMDTFFKFSIILLVIFIWVYKRSGSQVLGSWTKSLGKQIKSKVEISNAE